MYTFAIYDRCVPFNRILSHPTRIIMYPAAAKQITLIPSYHILLHTLL